MAGSRESSRTTSEPPGSYELSAPRPCSKGKSQESSYEPGGSDVVRELSREPAMFRQEKRAQRLSFWVRRPPGGVGVFHSKGWWPKTLCPPSKLCLPWVSKRGIWDVPGILPGSRTPGGVQKVCAKKLRAHFSFPTCFRLDCRERY